MDCGTLTNPANGQVSYSGRTTFGQTATYRCNSGYNLVGGSSRTCQATRRWSGSTPTCQSMLFISFKAHKDNVSPLQQVWTVALCLTQPMAKLVTLVEHHWDRQQPTVVMQTTTWWEAVHAHVKLQDCGLGVHLLVIVRCCLLRTMSCKLLDSMCCQIPQPSKLAVGLCYNRLAI